MCNTVGKLYKYGPVDCCFPQGGSRPIGSLIRDLSRHFAECERTNAALLLAQFQARSFTPNIESFIVFHGNFGTEEFNRPETLG